MMGSSHLDHLIQQEELHGFSPLATVPSSCDLASSRDWNQNQVLNCGDFLSNNANGGVLSGCRDNFSLIHDLSPVSSHMIQRDLGFHWHSTSEEGFLNQPQANQVNAEKVKEEYLPNYSSFLKLTGESNGDYQVHEKQFVRALSSDCQADGLQPLPGNLPESTSFANYRGARDGFNCMTFPAASLSHSVLNSSVISEMDFGALDLLASARLGRTLCQPSLTLLRDQDHVSSGLKHLHESIQGPFYLEQKMPSLVSGVTEVSRSSNSTWEHKSSQSAPMRKPRFEQRSSFSPFKVRKEKLGDRIAALQQLVAPFGKTDTASVLMEAIGYIKFLLEQVEKLSVPYMRPSGNKRSRIVQEASDEERSEEARRDLRSRGLCLVPLSCTSYMTSEHGTVWSPSNYGGSV